MALRLLAVLISLALVYTVPQLARWRDDRWFRAWVDRLAETSGAGRVTIALLLPVAVCAALASIFAAMPLLDLAWLILAVVVLAYTLGPRELEMDIDGILKAPDSVSREAAIQALRQDDQPLPYHAPTLVEAAMLAALRRRFGVLFWFFLLGPAGALFYRLAQTLGRDASMGLDATTSTAARRFADALDWIPAHLMVFAMALVSDFDAVIGAWREWHRRSGRPLSRLDPDFLGAVARAGVDADVEAGDGYAHDVSDPLVELADTRRVVFRVLIVWLGVAAVIVVAALLA
ncbi:MAG TPA: cobalamin biosynthesis protein [Luteibacter sp.]|jgi:AmpE protein|nr:cobalamin biosynthesis protein [Luteibacter sp.]